MQEQEEFPKETVYLGSRLEHYKQNPVSSVNMVCYEVDKQVQQKAS